MFYVLILNLSALMFVDLSE